jgi:hypothetical protein
MKQQVYLMVICLFISQIAFTQTPNFEGILYYDLKYHDKTEEMSDEEPAGTQYVH